MSAKRSATSEYRGRASARIIYLDSVRIERAARRARKTEAAHRATPSRTGGVSFGSGDEPRCRFHRAAWVVGSSSFTPSAYPPGFLPVAAAAYLTAIVVLVVCVR